MINNKYKLLLRKYANKQELIILTLKYLNNMININS